MRDKLVGIITPKQSMTGSLGKTISYVPVAGATFIPNVSDEGIISWTNDRELENPNPVNIKGQPGEQGLKGEDAKINGVNTLNIVAGANITLNQEGNTLQLNARDYDDTNLRNAINQINEDLGKTDSKVQEIENDIDRIDEELTQFVKKNVNDLVNYYKKSETYTQTEINNLIGAIKTVSMKVLPERPQTGETNIIYLIPSSKQTTDNVYNEWIYVDNKWELIGSTSVDLTNYYTKEEINTLLFDYITSNDLEEALKDYVTISMKYDFVKDGIVNNTNSLSDEEQLKIETWLGLAHNYLTYYNETPYQVNSDYIPAHKKYVDDKIGNIETILQDIDTGAGV